jgi:dTDP-4-dehydrorhamnose 3,5-epimerase
MGIRVETTPLPDLCIVRHEVHQDHRGFFMEVFRQDQFAAAGLPTSFVQFNHSRSTRGVLRGLHFQWEPPVSKMMRVIQGTAFLVAVDIRKKSPTLGQWFGMEFSATDQAQLWAPPGFARGFLVLSEVAEIQYFCTGIYNPKCESGILWQDPAIGIQWPKAVTEQDGPILSEKDRIAQTLDDWLQRPESELF